MNETLDINGQVYETDGIELPADEAIVVAAEWVKRGRGVYLENTGHAAIGDGVFFFLVWLATGQERYQ
jgi:hypothetical protein